MRALGVDELEICPWALREGVILRRLDAEPDHAEAAVRVSGAGR
jgi:exopolyphosphatase/guanosine-5'-triphosphate,3'-diphosphate pyrophosphatase